MKIIKILIFIFIVFQLHSITLVDEHKNVTIQLEDLREISSNQLETYREDKKAKDIWEGFLLTEVLKYYKVRDYNTLKFISKDNYLVRLSFNEVKDHDPILAYKQNNRNLEKLRLIVPQMRDMYWIQDIEKIITQKKNLSIYPHSAFFAEDILNPQKVRDDLSPFTKVRGFKLIDLIQDVFPLQQGEFLLVGKDGVSHKLSYEKHLKNSVLIENEGKYDLKSPDMPAGMWIKDIALIQQLDRLIIFRDQLKDFAHVSSLLNLDHIPKLIKLDNQEVIKSNLKFSDDRWQKTGLMQW